MADDCCDPTREDLQNDLQSAERGRHLWMCRAIDARSALQRVLERPEDAQRIVLDALGKVRPTVKPEIAMLLGRLKYGGQKAKSAARRLRRNYGVFP